jgi:hypothetical protein
VTTSSAQATATAPPVTSRHDLAASLVGGFFLVMAGVHLGLISSDPEAYRHFADHAPMGFVRTGWAEVFMAAPVVFGALLMLGEISIGTLLLAEGRAAQVGWFLAVAFHALLLLFGWWAWVWAVPAGTLLAILARRSVRQAER